MDLPEEDRLGFKVKGVSAELEMDLEIFRMHRLGLLQERIANRLSVPQRTLSDHLAKMPSLAIPLNGDPERKKSLAKAQRRQDY